MYYDYLTDLTAQVARQRKIDRTPILDTDRKYRAYDNGSREIPCCGDYNAAIAEYLIECGALEYGEKFSFEF